jgi:peptide/nickel transport system permease protein
VHDCGELSEKVTKYILQRLILAAFTLIGVLTCVFLLLRALPGDPAQLILGEFATPASLEQLREQLGLNRPLYTQYVIFVKDMSQLDFGRSIVTRQSVVQEIRWVLPHTVYLALAAMLISAILGTVTGIISARARNTAFDHISRVISLIGMSMPEFWFGILLVQIFALRLNLFPAIGGGQSGNPLDILYHLVLPATALGMAMAALTARMTRSSMLEVLNQDYIRTARAKGLSVNATMTRHALRNAMIPIVTIIGLNTGRLLGGAVIIEIVYARPGLGKLLVDAIFARDYPTVQGVITVIALAFILVNLLVDLTYAVIDPRIQYD